MLFEYGFDKIDVNGTTFTSYFPTRGISQQFQTLPGFASETDTGQGISANDEVVYNVLSAVQFWVDGVLQPSLIQDTQIRVRNRPSSTPDTILSSHSGEQPGSFAPPLNRIGRASASGNFHSDLQWFLESTEDGAQPPKGTYAIQLSLTTNRSGIANSDPFYFIWHYGAEEADFHNAVDFFDAQLASPSVPGDFDMNGQLDTNDAEALVVAIRAGANDLRFDLDGDTTVSLSDLSFWVTAIAETWHGDVDLDGEFSSSDLVTVFQAGTYESSEVATWHQGDWNADGQFASSDLVLAFQDGGYERGPRAVQARTVPEPIGMSVIIFALIAFVVTLQHAAAARQLIATPESRETAKRNQSTHWRF